VRAGDGGALGARQHEGHERRDAELPADLLDGRLAASHEPEDASSATRIAQVAQLADRGDHAVAAQEAAGLIAAGIPDVRVIGFYLFGVFLQRGIAYLPALLARMAALVADDLAALRPSRRKQQVVNSATAWLFEHVSTQLVFHTRHRSAAWDAWFAECDSALPDAIATGCSKLTLALEAVIDAPLAAVPLARVRRWALEDLRRALVRREAAPERAPAVASGGAAVAKVSDHAAPEPASGGSTVAKLSGRAAPEPASGFVAAVDDVDGDPANAPTGWPDVRAVPTGWPDDRAVPGAHAELEADEARGREADPIGFPAAPRARANRGPDRTDPGDAPVAMGSPALAVLQAKLAGFQDLVARGELARAAVVASDVRAVLASFDPVAYFPSMFAAYFKALHQVIDQLSPHLDGADLASWHALDSYYRADMRAFFDD
jgi:hypothetical protein